MSSISTNSKDEGAGAPKVGQMRKALFVLCKQNSKKQVHVTQDRSQLKDKLRALHKYGMFADIDEKIDGVEPKVTAKAMAAPTPAVTTTEEKIRQRKRSSIHLPRPPTKRMSLQAQGLCELWRTLRRESQLPEFEQYLNIPARDYMDADPQTLNAIRKTRSRIFGNVHSTGDRFSRLARLRHNVYAIEKKFMSLLKNGSRSEREMTRIRFPKDHVPSRFKEYGQAYAYFRKQARIVLTAITWLNCVFTKNELQQELKTFAHVAVEMEQTTEQASSFKDIGMDFDKNYYKANKEISLSADVRHFLSLASEARTPHMLQQVLHGLQTLQSLCEYPLKTQERLCRVAWYQKVEAKKVILRQGHHPESFYFILSGAAYVKKMEQDTESGEQITSTVARLTRGQSFGEVSLIFETLRTATVESATPMELLVIGKNDFLTIFINTDDPESEAEHISFLRQVPLMYDWPIDVLKTEPGACLLHYFKRGTLVTENGRTSEWLYFIKSGSCEAIKRLKAVKGRTPRYLKRHPTSAYDVNLPKLSTHDIASSRTDSGLGCRRKPATNPDVMDSMKTYYDGVRRANYGPGSSKSVQRNLPNRPRPSTSFHTGETTHSKRKNFVFITEEESRYRIPPHPPTKPEGGPGMSRPKITNAYFESHHNMMPASVQFQVRPRVTVTRTSDGEQLTPAPAKEEQVFVQVDVLENKDIFGMQTLDSDNEGETTEKAGPDIALVSHGAEVVLLSKRTFLKYANDKVRSAIQNMIRCYPGEDTLQENLQIKADWDTYRQYVMDDVLRVKRSMRSPCAVTR